jgi:hypothetical protein
MEVDMRRITLAVAAAVLFLGLGAAAQVRLGMGASFMAEAPIFDLYIESSFSPAFGLRTTFSYLTSFFEYVAFELDLSLMAFIGEGPIVPFIGGGGGGLIIAGGGAFGGIFTVNALGGAYFFLSDNIGLYAQARFMGAMMGDTFSTVIGPSAGICISF